jgi:hypothetical protein
MAALRDAFAITYLLAAVPSRGLGSWFVVLGTFPTARA